MKGLGYKKNLRNNETEVQFKWFDICKSYNIKHKLYKIVLHQVDINVWRKKLRFTLTYIQISDENESRKMALLHHVIRMFTRPHTSYSTGGVM